MTEDNEKHLLLVQINIQNIVFSTMFLSYTLTSLSNVFRWIVKPTYLEEEPQQYCSYIYSHFQTVFSPQIILYYFMSNLNIDTNDK